MLTPKQLEIRRSGITASDVRVLVGCEPYARTVHDVWSSKVLGHDPKPTTEAMALGNAIEPIVLASLAEKTGLHKLRVDPETLTIRGENPRHVATPDCLLSTSAFHDPSFLGEVKVPGLHAMSGWGASGTDEIPDWVLVQTTWQMHVWKIPQCYVGALLGTEVRVYGPIALDAELEGACVEAADLFWSDYVLLQIPPPVDGSAGAHRMIEKLFPRNRLPAHQAGPEEERLARAYFEAKGRRDEADSEVEKTKQELQLRIAEHDGLTGDGWRVFYKERAAVSIPATTRKAYRHWDMRPIGAKKDNDK